MITGCSSKSENEGSSKTSDISVGIVLGEGSINDESFNQATWEGLKQAEEEFGIDVKYLESKQQSDYIPNIETLIDEDTDLIIGVGYQLKDAIQSSAENYPEINFAILDETYENIPSNVIPVVFNEQESAYLTGVIAAKMSKTNKVGFIGGLPAPSVVKYQYGYKYGAETTNKDVQVYEQYTNTFTDQAKGKAIANQMHTSGVDVILGAAGDCGTGAIEAAKENNKYAIGAEQLVELRKMIKRLFQWGFGIALAFTLLYALSGEGFLQLLTNDQSVIVASKEYFFWAILIPIAGYSAFLMDGIFIGATRTRYMLWGMLTASFAFFIIYLGLKGMGNHALWAAFIIYLSIRSIVQRILGRKILQ